MAVKGLDNVTRNLNREIAAIEGRSRDGLLLAAQHVSAESVSMAPVDTGNLRGSAFADVTAPGATPIVARAGFTAKYAPYVHEVPAPVTSKIVKRRGKLHTTWAPGTGPKFLQRAISENVGAILDIIKRYAQIPGGGGA